MRKKVPKPFCSDQRMSTCAGDRPVCTPNRQSAKRRRRPNTRARSASDETDLLCDRPQCRIVESCPSHQRAVGLNDDVVRAAVIDDDALLIKGVQFDLIDFWFRYSGGGEFCEVDMTLSRAQC